MSDLFVDGLIANDHRYGAGKTHIMEGLKTRCGRTTRDCPGEYERVHLDEVTCLICVKSYEAAQRHERNQERWASERMEYEKGRQQEQADWREAYDAYLKSSAWRERRELVMERANSRCEGCLRKYATQVHHLTYQRLGDEMLFDLVAVCHDCHLRIHQ